MIYKNFKCALCLIWSLYSPVFGKAEAKAQLDLPPLPSPQPEIYYNGYTATTPAQNLADHDRDQRYGPPYADLVNADDGSDDYRNGQQYDERIRSGLNYGLQPYHPLNTSSRQDSPFSDRNIYNSNINQNDRYSNHNYETNNQQINQQSYSDRYASNFNQQRDRYNNNPNNHLNDDRGYNNAAGPTYNNNNNNNNNPLQQSYNPNDPYNRERNRFENPFDPNQDRFNLNQRFYDRQRYQQDQRYKIELEKLRTLLVETDRKASEECTANVAAQWNFETNVNDFTQTEALNAQQHYVEFQRLVALQSKQINKELIFDRRLYRQLMLQSEVGPNALPLESLDRYNRLINEMLYIYNGASICAYQQPFLCNLRYIPDLKEIMAKSRDWDELQHTWVEYHRKAGREMRDGYEQLVDVMNEVAFVNNVTNGGEYWYLAYESGNFRQDVEIVWEQIRPLYEALHAYVRRRLREYYGPERVNRIAPIPSHIMGNMYGQSWSNILDIIIPYPGKKLIDVTPRMLEQGYTPEYMFQLAEEFFTSINMSAVGPEFYQNSVIEQPLNRRILCEPSAWDFCNRHDFRVKVCTDINQKSLISVHHEMAHIQYFLQYRHLPKVFRNGANPAFHQAIGDAIGLSIGTPKHFQTLGLLQRSVDESSYDINYLFTTAIDKVAFMPFALALDNWRYDIFSSRANKHMMNCHYWNLREKYGGIKPPVLRSEKDFDAGAKYHVPANIPYINHYSFLSIYTTLIKDLKNAIASNASVEICEKILLYLDGLIIDKNKIRRERAKQRAESTAAITSDTILKCISYDGKKEKTLKKQKLDNGVRLHRTIEEHITIVKEPTSTFLGYVTPINGTGKEIQKAIVNFLNSEGYSLNYLVSINSDGTGVNTGYKLGVNAFLEKYLQRPLQWNICLFHFNELPLKSLLTSLLGKQVGPGIWPGEIGSGILDCNKEQVADFEPISMGEMPENIDDWDIRADQLYLFRMVLAVNNGVCDNGLARQNPGPVSTARWLTTASRILRLYVSKSQPFEKLKNLVKFIVKVYAPFWFLVKSKPLAIHASRHVFKYIQWIRQLPLQTQLIIRPTIGHNSYYLHPENVLLAMITDPDPEVRFLGYEHIRTTRNDPPAKIREFHVPKEQINFDCSALKDIINWEKVEFTEPPCLHFHTDEQLIQYQYSTHDIIEIPEFPCHSQSTERFVQVVNEAATKVTDEKRMGYILSKIRSREQYKRLDSRQDLI